MGQDPIQVKVYETASDRMSGWVQDRLKDVVLVRASAWSDMDALAEARERGVIGEVYWLVPVNIYEDITDAKGIIKKYLEETDSGFSEAQLLDMQMHEGCLSGQIRGIDMHVCNFTNLPFIEDPVVLSADVSFFALMADMRGINKIGSVKLLMDALEKKGLRVIQADVTVGVLEGRTRPIHRFVGEAAAELMRNPKMLTSEKPPELWMIRDHAESMFAEGMYDDLKEYLKSVPESYAADPTIRLLHASLMVRKGRYDEALATGEDVCRHAPEYCTGLQYLGYIAGLEDKEDWKERFMRRAAELSPKDVPLPEKLSYSGPFIQAPE